jgi:ribosomal protein L35AE/L33A
VICTGHLALLLYRNHRGSVQLTSLSVGAKVGWRDRCEGGRKMWNEVVRLHLLQGTGPTSVSRSSENQYNSQSTYPVSGSKPGGLEYEE